MIRIGITLPDGTQLTIDLGQVLEAAQPDQPAQVVEEPPVATEEDAAPSLQLAVEPYELTETELAAHRLKMGRGLKAAERVVSWHGTPLPRRSGWDRWGRCPGCGTNPDLCLAIPGKCHFDDGGHWIGAPEQSA